MGEVSLCRMDTATVGRAERKEWQNLPMNLNSMARSKWPHNSPANKFKGLKKCVQG